MVKLNKLEKFLSWKMDPGKCIEEATRISSVQSTREENRKNKCNKITKNQQRKIY